MFDYELLPQLNDFIITKKSERNSSESRVSSKDKAVQTQVSNNFSDKNQIVTPTIATTQDKKRVLFLNLPPAINNSLLVRQRASAKDSLAAASLSAAIPLPLMIGGRSKCVVNLLDNNLQIESEQDNSHQGDSDPYVEPDKATSSSIQPISAASVTTTVNQKTTQDVVPKNTALRAEQRRQNMVSVVRPVINTTTSQPVINSLSASSTGSSSSSSSTSFNSSYKQSARTILDDSIPEWCDNQVSHKASIIDDFIDLEQKARSKLNSKLDRATSINNFYNSNLDDLYLLEKLNPNHPHKNQNKRQLNEHQMKQQMILMKREEHELNRSVKKQHRFFMVKVEERKRNLQIIQSVWCQRDLKHAIEKLVDLYNEGLIFTCQDGSKSSNTNYHGEKQGESVKLKSLNTSLVVDIIGILILRPKLWNLEICQLILPILVNDLLVQYDSPNNETNKYEYYIEVALKALKLILTHFSPVIKTTLESLKETGKLIGKVDLSREDRVSKCLKCYKFLLEAQGIIMKHQAYSKKSDNKLSFLYRDLAQSFVMFQASFQDIQDISQGSRKK